ncbi:prolipoprotein diacylglyceryl transferase [bacterium]|nr:prolipoprotein diacylglyceryl transferase [bacterium]
MFPVLIQIGPIVVYSLWLFAGIGFLFGVFVFSFIAQQKRLNISFIYDHSISLFIFGMISSRLFFVLENFQYYFQDYSIQSFTKIFFVWDKGLSLLGCLVGIILALFYYSKKEHEQTKKWLDILTISTISALAIGHIGTFLDGSSYGNVTSLPWGMIFDNPSIKYAVPIHPTQLYAFLYSTILAISLFIYYRRKKPIAGKITIIGLVSYFSFIFLEGFLRGDDVFMYAGLREEQWFSLLIFIIIGGYLLRRYNRKRKSQESKKSNSV